MNEKVTIHDIHKRLRNLPKSNSDEGKTISSFKENARFTVNAMIPRDIIKTIEYSGKHSPVYLESVLDLFDALYECGNPSQLSKIGSYICEEVIPKVRDSKETNTNLKYKLGRIKSKVTTKISNNIKDARNSVKSALNNVQKSVSSNMTANTAKIKDNVNKGLHIKQNEAYIAAYESMVEASELYVHCDRIIDNYNRISKRFNLEKLFIENTRMNSMEDTVCELCRFVETYDMPNIVKFNTVIETAWFGFESNDLEYSKKDLLETACNYFMMKPNGYSECKKILESTTIYQPEDLPDDMQVLLEKDPVKRKTLEDEIRDYCGGFKNNGLTNNGTVEESSSIHEATDFNKIFSDFKKTDEDPAKKESKLNMLVRKMYTRNVDNIVDGTPNFLNWVRLVLVLGTVAMNPIVGAVVFIGDIFARLHFERNETERMLKCFDNEIKKTQSKIKTTKDAEEKRRLNTYLDSVKKTRSKIDDYYTDMLTDKEIDAKFDNEVQPDSFDDIKSDIAGEDDDDDWDDDDLDDWDNIDESTSKKHTANLKVISNLISSIDNSTDDILDTNNIGMDTITHMSIFNGDDIESLSKLSALFPDVWSPDLMESAIKTQIYKIRKGKIVFESVLDRFAMLNSYDNSINNIHNGHTIEYADLTEAAYYTSALAEACESIHAIIDTYNHKDMMIEGSIINTLKLAGEKFKKTMVKLSDKDKRASETVDVSLSNFRKSIDRALSADNREAVIKGSIIPSGSKIIKLAITTGAVWLVNPAVAVIGALGYIGLSGKHRIKERQLILDELEIELKMCEKYIDIAESKNDMKSLKQLMTIQKDLQRQRQKIKYHMKVDFNQNTEKPDVQ